MVVRKRSEELTQESRERTKNKGESVGVLALKHIAVLLGLYFLPLFLNKAQQMFSEEQIQLTDLNCHKTNQPLARSCPVKPNTQISIFPIEHAQSNYAVWLAVKNNTYLYSPNSWVRIWVDGMVKIHSRRGGYKEIPVKQRSWVITGFETGNDTSHRARVVVLPNLEKGDKVTFEVYAVKVFTDTRSSIHNVDLLREKQFYVAAVVEIEPKYISQRLVVIRSAALCCLLYLLVIHVKKALHHRKFYTATNYSILLLFALVTTALWPTSLAKTPYFEYMSKGSASHTDFQINFIVHAALHCALNAQSFTSFTYTPPGVITKTILAIYFVMHIGTSIVRYSSSYDIHYHSAYSVEWFHRRYVNLEVLNAMRVLQGIVDYGSMAAYVFMYVYKGVKLSIGSSIYLFVLMIEQRYTKGLFGTYRPGEMNFPKSVLDSLIIVLALGVVADRGRTKWR